VNPIEINMASKRLNIAVGIATVGRRELLARTVDFLAKQTRMPDLLVICPAAPKDVDVACLERFGGPYVVVAGGIGSSAQRNRIMSASSEADVIVFFDDDFLPCEDYLAELEKLLLLDSNVIVVTGKYLADGANGPGLSMEQGLAIISEAIPVPTDVASVSDMYGTYGCNMAFRLDPIRKNGILFDENLPLYGWQEDIDFAVRLAPFGKIVKSTRLRGVHLGTKLGRTSGVRFGYSQIANPVYLIRKGSMSWQHAKKLMWRNLAANLIRSLKPEPWVDRRGRLKGNILALIDIAKGRVSPSRILKLES
jgi:GT2 family glycosyltransferase